MSQYNGALVADMISTGSTGSRETNDELYPLVVQGDRQAMDKMIESNMSLVVSKVDAHIGCIPAVKYLRDDLISGGFVGLCTAVNKMAEAGEVENANPTGYISYWVMKHIGLVVDGEMANGASSWTVWDHKNRGEELPKSVAITEDMVAHDIIVDPMSMVDLRDLIESCCENDIDRDIIRMRERGNKPPSDTPSEHPCMVDKEIAAALDLPVTTTYMMRRAIYARFLEKSGLRGEI